MQLQKNISIITGWALSLDGVFGPATEAALKTVQKSIGIPETGTATEQVQALIQEKAGNHKFVVFIDAGHGGWDGVKHYTDPRNGKWAKHKGIPAHDGEGMYFEGHENRIAADYFWYLLKWEGIAAVKLHEPLNDTPLRRRTDILKTWLTSGHIGYLHSFHSNASPDNKNNDNIRGACVFTSIGQNLSDKIADWHFDNMLAEFGKDFVWRMDKSDGDKDYEANFHMLYIAEIGAHKNFGAILEEFGFHTSKSDVKLITDPENRKLRAKAAFNTALQVKQLLS
jgi:N-acetylmuramoyl-L-alanine amidase